MPSPVNRRCLRAVLAEAGTRAGAAARWLWPGHCLICREPAAVAGIDLCHACRRSLPWQRTACPTCALPLAASAPACGRCQRRPPPVAATRAAFRYEPPFDHLLPRLKFHDDLAAGRLCATLMAEALVEALADGPRPDALVPLPLHRARLRRRGFDQSLELARPLARTLGVPLRDDVLFRVRDTAPQSRLDAPARRRNLRGAFAVHAERPLPAHIALIDDVMTTGTTLHAAAEALRRAGVARVEAWVCARVA